MKSLKIIQVLAVIARIICLVSFILCIIGASLCGISLIVLPIISNVVFFDGKTFSELLVEGGTNIATLITFSALGLVSCGVLIFLSKYNELFFVKEIKIGTPFRKVVVRDMRILAIINMAVGLGTMIVLASAFAIVKYLFPETQNWRDGFGWSIGFGITMIIISLFCDYGAEKEEVEVIDNVEPEDPKEENK